MKRVTMQVDFKSSVDQVFKTITNLSDYSWRSDLKDTIMVDEYKYIEYNRRGRQTKILVTDCRKNIQFEYDVQSDDYSGHWSGQFASLNDGGCRLFLVFDFSPDSLLGKFVRPDWFEKRYIEDLKKKLGEL